MDDLLEFFITTGLINNHSESSNGFGCHNLSEGDEPTEDKPDDIDSSDFDDSDY